MRCIGLGAFGVLLVLLFIGCFELYLVILGGFDVSCLIMVVDLLVTD